MPKWGPQGIGTITPIIPETKKEVKTKWGPQGISPTALITPTPTPTLPPKPIITPPPTIISPTTIKEPTTFIEKLEKIGEEERKAGWEAIKEPVKQLLKTGIELLTPEQKTWSERLANVLEYGVATVSVVFSPISAVFSMAEKNPLMKPAADIISLPFSLTGKIGTFTADKFVNVLPINQKDKDILRPAFKDVGSLTGQIVLGGAIMRRVFKGEK